MSPYRDLQCWDCGERPPTTRSVWCVECRAAYVKRLEEKLALAFETGTYTEKKRA